MALPTAYRYAATDLREKANELFEISKVVACNPETTIEGFRIARISGFLTEVAASLEESARYKREGKEWIAQDL